MKSWKYLAIALSVAGVALTAAPADAGSVGAKGGTSKKVTVIDNVYREDSVKNTYTKKTVDKYTDKTVDNVTKKTVDKYTDKTVDNVTKKTVDNTTTKNVEKTATGKTTIVKGKDIVNDGSTRVEVTVKGVHDIFGGAGGVDNVGTYKYDSKSDAKKAVGKMAIDAVKAGRSGYSMKNAYYTSTGAFQSSDKNIKGVKAGVHTDAGWLGWNHNDGLTGGTTSKDGKKVFVKTTYDNVKTTKRRELTNTTTKLESSSVTKKLNSSTTDTKLTSSNTVRTLTSSNTKTELVSSKTARTLESSKTELTGCKYNFNNVNYTFSDDCIVIGDVDSGNSYVAQGTLTQENHYDRTDYYLTTNNYLDTTTNNYLRTKTNNYTETTTNNYVKTNTYTTYTDTTKTSHDNYKQNYVYKVNMKVSVTPIVLDLDGDGRIEASEGKYMPHANTEFSKNAVMFDFYGNGFPVMMEWVGTNDGLLCRPDADGTVKGTNLFGSANGYKNGYDELASLDTNRDGALTGEELTGLMVWQDENHNGVADKDELKSLESLGITSIGVINKNLTGTYTRNGQSFRSFDWNPTIKQVQKINVAH